MYEGTEQYLSVEILGNGALLQVRKTKHWYDGPITWDDTRQTTTIDEVVDNDYVGNEELRELRGSLQELQRKYVDSGNK